MANATAAADKASKVSVKRAEVQKLQAEQSRCRANPKACTAAHVSKVHSSLLNATKQMQQMQMSFNLQYLMLQNKINHENRQFTLMSNIMKNKHDTAKNSINNIR
jgi:hypothetical protein